VPTLKDNNFDIVQQPLEETDAAGGYLLTSSLNAVTVRGVIFPLSLMTEILPVTRQLQIILARSQALSRGVVFVEMLEVAINILNK